MKPDQTSSSVFLPAFFLCCHLFAAFALYIYLHPFLIIYYLFFAFGHHARAVYELRVIHGVSCACYDGSCRRPNSIGGGHFSKQPDWGWQTSWGERISLQRVKSFVATVVAAAAVVVVVVVAAAAAAAMPLTCFSSFSPYFSP